MVISNSVRGILLYWIIVGQGPTVLAMGVLVWLFFFLTNLLFISHGSSGAYMIGSCLCRYHRRCPHRHRKFRILGGPRFRILGGGGHGGGNSQQAHDVALTSMRRNDVASTSVQRHVPTRFLINHCQIITFLILKSDNIENSRVELKGIVLPVPSNQIKITFFIILLFNLIRL